jgi:hypothetical protein
MAENPMPRPRHPSLVPDDDLVDPVGSPALSTNRFDVSYGIDTDGDGRPDTVAAGDGVDLVLLTDLDGDGFADRILRIGPDAVVREQTPGPAAGAAASAVADGLRNGAEVGYEP